MNTCKNSILFNSLFFLLISFFSCKKEEEKIMMVRNDSISDVSHTTAKAYATIIDQGEGIEQHGHCWSVNAESITIETENKTEIGIANNTGSYTSIIDNLTPGQSYYVRAYVKNGSDIVYGADILPFTTLSMIKPVVTTGTVSKITKSSAVVSGNLNSLGAGASSVTDHGHCWSSETITPTIENSTSSSLGSRDSTGIYESQPVGLSPITKYYIRAYAINDAGIEYGDTTSFTTLNNIDAEFSASPRSGFLPLDVQFSDMSIGNINSWSWNFGDGKTSNAVNPLHTYNDQGSYSVALTISGYDGSDSETKHNYIIVSTIGSEPVAAFTANKISIIEGDSVSFTDQSLNVPETWSWTFGDGGTSTEQNPTYQYNSNGTYTVSLTVSNSYGSDIKTKNSYITVSTSGSAPDANFSADKFSIVEGETVNFMDQSTNGPTSWSWTFGDGGTSSSQNPSYQYNNQGIYTVILVVSNSYGSDTETKSNFITVSTSGSAPDANFSADKFSIVEGETVNFMDQSTNGPTSWSWTFGDGGTSSSQNPSHQYNTEGTYDVTLTATNSYGSDIESKNNYIAVEQADTTGILTDLRDNKQYSTIKIGDQWWMAENLAYLPSVSPPSIESHTESYYYVYDYNGSDVDAAKTTDNYQTYGVLYNWPAAQEACPSGWHLPSDEEFKELERTLGMSEAQINAQDFRGTDEGGKLKEAGTEHWDAPNTGATNEYGFTALPSGKEFNNSFVNINQTFGIWSSTSYTSTGAYDRLIISELATIKRISYREKESGQAVRCVKD